MASLCKATARASSASCVGPAGSSDAVAHTGSNTCEYTHTRMCHIRVLSCTIKSASTQQAHNMMDDINIDYTNISHINKHQININKININESIPLPFPALALLPDAMPLKRNMVHTAEARRLASLAGYPEVTVMPVHVSSVCVCIHACMDAHVCVCSCVCVAWLGLRLCPLHGAGVTTVQWDSCMKNECHNCSH